jgi:hypothetical protein
MYYQCLKCGRTARGNKHSHPCKTAGCISDTVSVCRQTAQLARALYATGFKIHFAEAYTTHVVTDNESEKEIAPNGWLLFSVCIEFARKYPSEIFKDLKKTAWFFLTYDEYERDARCLAYHDYIPFTGQNRKFINREFRAIMWELFKWIGEYEQSEKWAVHVLMGWL